VKPARKAGRLRRPLEVIGVDHIYLTVSDLHRSERFYDRLMRRLGFFKGTFRIGGDPHAAYFNRHLALTIRPARRRARARDRYAPGLHHLSLRVKDASGVDRAARILKSLGIRIEGPQLWPQYAPDYYAVFFNDPDGIRLEVMNYLSRRRLIRRRWNELRGFVNPVRRLLRGRPRSSRARSGRQTPSARAATRKRRHQP
jgi:catechol 2,3-dioxygenase-like lactoylglutathione lyase family enzyme